MSGLSFLSKLVERIVAAQIRSHMDSHDLGNTFQSAYKVGHSTETALLCIKNEIHLSLSKGMPTALVLLDLSAAFDTIDHDTLLSCLSSRFGFAGSALKRFRSYLQDRFQSVKIGSSLSNLFKLKFGVPQGCVLGPLLFSLYTTPLSQVIRKYTGVRYHFYADDTQLFIHLSPDDSLKSFDRLKSCLNDIQVWMSENKLKLNPDKTEFIVFGAKDRHKWLSDSLLGVGRVQIIRVDYSQIKTRLDIEHSRGLVSTSTGNDIQYGGSRKQKKYKGKSFESLELVIVST